MLLRQALAPRTNIFLPPKTPASCDTNHEGRENIRVFKTSLMFEMNFGWLGRERERRSSFWSDTKNFWWHVALFLGNFWKLGSLKQFKKLGSWHSIFESFGRKFLHSFHDELKATFSNSKFSENSKIRKPDFWELLTKGEWDWRR